MLVHFERISDFWPNFKFPLEHVMKVVYPEFKTEEVPRVPEPVSSIKFVTNW